jgi:ABC-type transport system involved in Fe-S cluster assembly fused permease/ATPase subunit
LNGDILKHNKVKQTDKIDRAINRYCVNHPIIAWLLIFIGMPILILISVAICTCIFAIPILLLN